MPNHRHAKMAVQEALAAALALQSHSGYRADRHGNVRCNCESMLCKACEGRGCGNKVPIHTNLIEFIGEVCPACYKSYPKDYHRGYYERSNLLDALKQYGAVGGARTRRRARKRQEYVKQGSRKARKKYAEGLWAQDYHRYLRGEENE